MFVLSITNLTNEFDIPFFRIEKDFRWIYVVSTNEPLLQNYKMKIESFTPQRYLPYLLIEILPREMLSNAEIQGNFNNLYNFTPELDRIYVEGITNCNRRESYSYHDFTPDRWDFWDPEVN